MWPHIYYLSNILQERAQMRITHANVKYFIKK